MVWFYSSGGSLLKWHVLFLFCLVAGGVSAQSSRRVHAGKVIVKLRGEALPAVEAQLKSRMSTDTSALTTGVKSLDRINRKYRAGGMKRIIPDAGEYEEKHRRYGLHLWYEIDIPENIDPETAAREYRTDAAVQTAEPAYRRRSLSAPASNASETWTPNDPSFNKQWHYHNTGQTGGVPGVDIRMPNAWRSVDYLGVKNRNVTVAVMDGGVYCEHEDLKANMWVNEAELNGAARKDDDDNGYTDDIYGYNFVTKTGVIQPEDHATHVAATIAAVTDNGTGVAGMSKDSYGVKVMAVQIMSGNSSVNSLLPAFVYAADKGAVISQNSWGYEDPDVYAEADVEAIRYFIEHAGKDKDGNPRPETPMAGGIVIFAAGNGHAGVNKGTDESWYPACLDEVVAVGAVDQHGRRTSYSNYGNWVDIAAPGGNTSEAGGGIYSASYRQRSDHHYYEYMQGTSMACPQVSGAATLILAVHGSKDFTPEMLRARLLDSTTPLNEYDPDRYATLGRGLLNVGKAISFNDPPIIGGLFADTTLLPDHPVRINLSQYVADPDGDPLNFACETDREDLLQASVKDGILTIDPKFHGSATLRIFAMDPYSIVNDSFAVHIEQKYAPKEAGRLLAYPNPVDDLFFYSFILEDGGALIHVRITNIGGRVVWQAPEVRYGAGAHYLQMNMSGWASGIYFLQYFRDGKKTDTVKIVKL
ncbi:MAG: S8 family serine peptidase [Bacteroidales bacterium]|jgi:subtilisin family serine protease|nr:S8 family serine peptidase [Bacteroidales bacterium]